MPRKTPPTEKPARVARSAATTSGDEPRMSYTSFILWPDQLLALKQIALREQAQRGGKADASAVLRELLDAVAQDRPLADGLKKALIEGIRQRPKN